MLYGKKSGFKKRLFFIIVVSVLLISSINVFSYLSPSNLYFPEENILSVREVKQAKNTWCWAASVEMAARYRSLLGRRQSDIIDKFGDPPGGASANLIKEAYEWAGPNNSVECYMTNFHNHSIIRSSIDNHYPVMGCLIKYNGNQPITGHTIAIKGYTYYWFLLDMTVHYIDPWDARTYSSSYLEMCNGVQVGPKEFKGYKLSIIVAH